MSDTAEPIDPRFLAGEEAVLTDVALMRWALAMDWNGTVDVHCNVPKPLAAAELRLIATQLDGRADDLTAKVTELAADRDRERQRADDAEGRIADTPEIIRDYFHALMPAAPQIAEDYAERLLRKLR